MIHFSEVISRSLCEKFDTHSDSVTTDKSKVTCSMCELILKRNSSTQIQAGPGLRCDFCNVLNVAWEHECASFEKVNLIFDETSDSKQFVETSIGNWAACEYCHSLIIGQQWIELARYSVKTMDLGPDSQELIYSQMIVLHSGFRQSRTGNFWRITRDGNRCDVATADTQVS